MSETHTRKKALVKREFLFLFSAFFSATFQTENFFFSVTIRIFLLFLTCERTILARSFSLFWSNFQDQFHFLLCLSLLSPARLDNRNNNEMRLTRTKEKKLLFSTILWWKIFKEKKIIAKRARFKLFSLRSRRDLPTNWADFLFECVRD